jgi:hypothetical protein
MPKGRRSPDRPAATERPALTEFDELTIGADGAEVRRATVWLEETCRRRRVPLEQADRLALCLHEVRANVIAHGGSIMAAARHYRRRSGCSSSSASSGTAARPA